MEPDDKFDELDRRVQRIEASLVRIAGQMEMLAKARHQIIQDILYSQAAYLGDHRALTYLRSGQKIFVDTRCVDVGSHLLLGGSWEANYAAAFTRLLRPGQIVLDLGANHGVYSLLAASHVAPGGHVYAFEPNPRFHSLIRDSIAINGFDSLVTLIAKAVADREGEMVLTFDDPHSARGRLRTDLPPSATGVEPTELTCVVETVVLDRQFPDSRIDVVKMDIEGAEGPALSGMVALIDRSPELKIMMEFCPRFMSAFMQNAEYVTEFLASRGFLCWKVNVDGATVPARWDALLAEPDTVQNIVVSRQGV